MSHTPLGCPNAFAQSSRPQRKPDVIAQAVAGAPSGFSGMHSPSSNNIRRLPRLRIDRKAHERKEAIAALISIYIMPHDSHSQPQEHERLARQLQVAGSAERSVELTLALIVVPYREHKGCEPEVAEDDVRERVVRFVGAEGEEDEGGEPKAENDADLVLCQ